MVILRPVYSFLSVWILFFVLLAVFSCDSEQLHEPGSKDPELRADFPPFITPVSDYFDIRKGAVPEIDQDSYQLEISGAVENPVSYSLDELRDLEMIEKTLTIECIENPSNGILLGNATWKGFNLYDLLSELGIKEGAKTVKYTCADGYYTFNSLDELKNDGVLGALYMNDSIIPPRYGFPLRIIFPGHYGVRQPGWIVSMEVLESEEEDYWGSRGWRTDTSTAIDSKIFFPAYNSRFHPGDTIAIGGAAYGAKRVSAVDVTVDDGISWIRATIKKSVDSDYAWVFWEVAYPSVSAGNLTIRSRATALDGTVQPFEDLNLFDGTNSWPAITVKIE